jgi:exodeoxyribonuclease-3
MFKTVTWNLNSVKARKERLLAFLSRENPDIVCVQELKGESENFPYAEVQALGYQASVFGQKTYNGVAVLSKTSPLSVHQGIGDGGENAARLIRVEFPSLSIINIYVPNGQAVGSEKYDYKLEWLTRFQKYLASHLITSPNTLIFGDFNIAPDDRDVYDPDGWSGKILCSEKEREAFVKLMGLGLFDTFRKHHEEGGHYSWWDYRQLGFQQNHGLRIDFILATRPLAEACSKTWIDRGERKGSLPSDHAPVIAEFNL